MKDRRNGLRVVAGAMAFGLVFSPFALYAQRNEINQGKPLGQLKDDQRTSDMLEELIGAEAALREGKVHDKADRRYAKYAKKLSKMLGKLDAAQQQEILYGSSK